MLYVAPPQPLLIQSEVYVHVFAPTLLKARSTSTPSPHLKTEIDIHFAADPARNADSKFQPGQPFSARVMHSRSVLERLHRATQARAMDNFTNSAFRKTKRGVVGLVVPVGRMCVLLFLGV